MNETLTSIKNRRSIRKYKPDQVGEKELEVIMEAAIYAPSAMNQQKWHFTVVQNGEMLDKLARKATENLLKSPIPFFVDRAKDPNFNVFHKAPTVVFITGDAEAGFMDLDCGMAAENIALAAESLGINSCMQAMPGEIFAGDDADALKKELGIPEGYRFVIAVALGYRDMDTPPAPPKKKENISYIK